MSKLDKNLDAASGILNMILASGAIYCIAYYSSAVVTLPFIISGMLLFGSMFMYGLQKFVTARE